MRNPGKIIAMLFEKYYLEKIYDKQQDVCKFRKKCSCNIKFVA
jgi:hypothetical protein